MNTGILMEMLRRVLMENILKQGDKYIEDVEINGKCIETWGQGLNYWRQGESNG